MWTLIAVIAWLAIQIPLAWLVGKCIELGMGEAERRQRPRKAVAGRDGARQA